MAYRELDITVPLALGPEELERYLQRKSGRGPHCRVLLKKSLDARDKRSINWVYRLGLYDQASQVPALPYEILQAVYRPRKRRIAVVGSGPAGIYAADFLLRSGFAVSLFERGSPVATRRAAIGALETGGALDPRNNYAFGEGGAGTFSDGKLSSRTKGISLRRNWLFQRMIDCGAPAEIRYLTHPHVGSDNLYTMTEVLRSQLLDLGLELHFDTTVEGLICSGSRVQGLSTTKGDFNCHGVIFACGHSAYDTIRMLIAQGLDFSPKNFAIGFRAEHRQSLINLAQWGQESLPGVKAAEYRLTANVGDRGVYSFCMCPGGRVVPAAAWSDCNIVNGMSDYQRGGAYANAAVVAACHPQEFLGSGATALATLEWLEALERRWFDAAGASYAAPACTIADFIAGQLGRGLGQTSRAFSGMSSYPLGLIDADLGALLPAPLAQALAEGLGIFARKLQGYEQGILLGLESKTSAAVQVDRHPTGLHSHFENLYLVGEGSGWSGGIVSSAADGLRVAEFLAKQSD
jgi:uncharacterized protein